jgi:hypothetical protein
MMIAANASPPRSRFYLIARRIATRFEPAVARAFLRAVDSLLASINDQQLLAAVMAGSLAQIEVAAHASGLAFPLMTDPELQRALLGASTATGRAGADVLTDAVGFRVRFNAIDANVVLYARRQAAQLVVAVSGDVRESIRIVVALGSQIGLTVEQQARAIREVVGLPPNWANAPLNLGIELRDGRFSTSRRMSAADKQQIRSRLAKGTVDEAFVARMQGRYAASLRNRRALNIARTETLRAAHFGQREGWRQAMREGSLPSNVRRTWIVTPDDRLRETHAAVPGMNPDGVGVDEPFRTPLGLSLGPPLEVNCRCGEGLIFPGLGGVL